MRISVPPQLMQRPADVDVSDLTSAERCGPPTWVPGADNVLEIPFSPEPTAAEQALIRRRLLTRDAAEEARVNKLVSARAGLPTGAVGDAIRALIDDRLFEIETAPATSSTSSASTTAARASVEVKR